MGSCTSIPGSPSQGRRVRPDASDAVCRSHFECVRVLGQGGFAQVHAVVKTKGHDKGTWYAMKTLRKAIILERNHVAMVMKERNLLARLHCPQMVNMHYAFQDAKNLYIVMDACLGGDLHFQLTRSPGKCFTETQARFYAASILLSLAHMHGAGVLHRDIKPENILLNSDGQIKVTDLGISSELTEGVCTSTSGTRPYMAPEIFMSGHKHGFAADFYALGITVYQFLLGHRPYKPDAGNMKAIVRMATFVPPDKYTDMTQIRRILVAAQERKAPSSEFKYSVRLARFSPEARDFIQTCLICNPKYRLGALGMRELMGHPWFNGLDWDAMRDQRVPAPFLPDTRIANCALTDTEIAAMLSQEEEADRAPPIPAAEQARFNGFDYRTRVKDSFSGRHERITRTVSSGGMGDSSGSTLYGDRERAPTISVTHTHDIVHSYASSIARGSGSAWTSHAGGSSEAGFGSPVVSSPFGVTAGGSPPASAASPLPAAPSAASVTAHKRSSLNTAISARGVVPSMASPSSPLLAGAVPVGSFRDHPAQGSGATGVLHALRSSLSGDPSSPSHSSSMRPSSKGVPVAFFAEPSGASATPYTASQPRRASALSPISAAPCERGVSGAVSPSHRRASHSGPTSPTNTSHGAAAARATSHAGSALFYPQQPGSRSPAGDYSPEVDLTAASEDIPGATAMHVGGIAAHARHAERAQFDVVALSGLPRRRSAEAPSDFAAAKVAYPSFLYSTPSETSAAAPAPQRAPSAPADDPVAENPAELGLPPSGMKHVRATSRHSDPSGPTARV